MNARLRAFEPISDCYSLRFHGTLMVTIRRSPLKNSSPANNSTVVRKNLIRLSPEGIAFTPLSSPVCIRGEGHPVSKSPRPDGFQECRVAWPGAQLSSKLFPVYRVPDLSEADRGCNGQSMF